MRVAYASDLHVEFQNQRAIKLAEPVDVLILAGDVHSKGRGLLWAYETYHEVARHVIVVYGNHDFWGGTYQKYLDEARTLAAVIPNLHFLEDSGVCIDGVFFIGGTTWTDYELLPGPRDWNATVAQQEMNDFDRIKWREPNGHYRKLRVNDIYQINQRSKRYIFETLKLIKKEHPGARTVVVTHHGPTAKSLDPSYHASRINAAYVSPWHEEILAGGPDYWIHGHVHDPKEYPVGETTVLVNPIGYPDQIPDASFKILEVEVAGPG